MNGPAPASSASRCSRTGSSIASICPDGVSTSSATSAGSPATGLRSGDNSSASTRLAGFRCLVRIAKARPIQQHLVRFAPGEVEDPAGVAELLKAKSRSPQTPAKASKISGNCSPRMLLTGYRQTLSTRPTTLICACPLVVEDQTIPGGRRMCQSVAC